MNNCAGKGRGEQWDGRDGAEGLGLQGSAGITWMCGAADESLGC